jgi:hypothetical protein
MSIVRPHESSYDLFKRKYSPEPFKLYNVVSNVAAGMDLVSFDDSFEIKTNIASEIPIAVLTVASQFAAQYTNGLIIHVSLNNNLFISLEQSGYLARNLDENLGRYHSDNRLKSLTIHSTIELMAAFAYLQHNISLATPTIVIMENLTPLLMIDNTVVSRI